MLDSLLGLLALAPTVIIWRYRNEFRRAAYTVAPVLIFLQSTKNMALPFLLFNLIFLLAICIYQSRDKTVEEICQKNTGKKAERLAKQEKEKAGRGKRLNWIAFGGVVMACIISMCIWSLHVNRAFPNDVTYSLDPIRSGSGLSKLLSLIAPENIGATLDSVRAFLGLSLSPHNSPPLSVLLGIDACFVLMAFLYFILTKTFRKDILAALLLANAAYFAYVAGLTLINAIIPLSGVINTNRYLSSGLIFSIGIFAIKAVELLSETEKTKMLLPVKSACLALALGVGVWFNSTYLWFNLAPAPQLMELRLISMERANDLRNAAGGVIPQMNYPLYVGESCPAVGSLFYMMNYDLGNLTLIVSSSDAEETISDMMDSSPYFFVTYPDEWIADFLHRRGVEGEIKTVYTLDELN